MDKSLEAQLKQLVERVDTLQETLDRAITQLDNDRKDISDLKVGMGKLGASVDGARDDILDQTKKVVNKIDENLQPVPRMVSKGVKDGIENLKKKKWYQIFSKGDDKHE